MKVDTDINRSILAAMEGEEPGLVITQEDDKLTLECFQQILSKLYATLRYRVYQKIKNKARAPYAKKSTLNRSSQLEDVVNYSEMSLGEIAAHVVVGEEDVDNLVRDIDTEWIRKEVFKLYDVKYGLDTQLALRKV